MIGASALGFDWARRHSDDVRGIAYMEAIVAPFVWNDMRGATRAIFEGFRSEKGEELILKHNAFIEQVLPEATLRVLADPEMEVYRRPFVISGEDRRPTLSWPRQIPIEGEPADVVAIVEAYGK